MEGWQRSGKHLGRVAGGASPAAGGLLRFLGDKLASVAPLIARSGDELTGMNAPGMPPICACQKERWHEAQALTFHDKCAGHDSMTEAPRATHRL